MRNPKLHSAIQLDCLTDEEIRGYSTFNYWTLVEAPFILTGHRPPTDESTHHFLDHSDLFPYEFREALNRAVEAGVLCQRYDRARQRRFGDTPVNWLAWADSLEQKDFSVDERVRRLLSSGNDEEPQPNPEPPEENEDDASPEESLYQKSERWRERERILMSGKEPKAKTYRKAAKIIAEAEGDDVDWEYVARETRRVRRGS